MVVLWDWEETDGRDDGSWVVAVMMVVVDLVVVQYY